MANMSSCHRMVTLINQCEMRASQVVYGLCLAIIGCLFLYLAAWCGYALLLVSEGVVIRLFMLLMGIGPLVAGVSLIFYAWRTIFRDSVKEAEVKPSSSVTQKPLNPSLIIVVWITIVCIGFLTADSIFSSALFYLLIGQYLIVGIHDIGHAVAAKGVGLVPTRLQIGLEPEILSFGLGRMRVGIGMNFFGGYVAAIRGKAEFTRTKNLAFELGGPIASFLLFVVVVAAACLIGFNDPLSQPIPLLLSMTLFVAQNFIMLIYLFVSDITIDGSQLKPDMPAIWECLVSSDQQWEANNPWLGKINNYIRRGMWNEAFEKALPYLQPHPQFALHFANFIMLVDREIVPIIKKLVDDTLSGGTQPSPQECSWLLFTQGACHAYQGEVAAAKKCLEEAFQSAPTDSDKVNLSEQLANLVIVQRLMDMLPEADRCSEYALLLEHESITLKGTRGSILVELGQLESGMEMLKEVFEKSESEHDKAISAFYIALGFRKVGDSASVLQWREEMMRHNPPGWLLVREGELDGGSSSSKLVPSSATTAAH